MSRVQRQSFHPNRFSKGKKNGLWRIANVILAISQVFPVDGNTSGPRVAICFFGLTRSLPYTIQSIRSAIYDPLITKNIQYDVFIHTYNVTQVHNPRSSEDHVAVDWTLYKLLQPMSTLIEDADDVFASRFASMFADLLANGDAWGEDHHTSLRNMMLQLHSLEKVHQLIEHASEKAPYDVIIASRSDLWFFNVLNVSHLLEASEMPSRIYIPDFDHYGGLNDRLAFGGVEAMNTYCNRIEKALEYAAIAKLHAESLLKYVIEDGKLDMHYTSIVFERVRSHGFLKSVPEFHNGPGKHFKSWRPGQWLKQDEFAMWKMSP